MPYGLTRKQKALLGQKELYRYLHLSCLHPGFQFDLAEGYSRAEYRLSCFARRYKKNITVHSKISSHPELGEAAFRRLAMANIQAMESSGLRVKTLLLHDFQGTNTQLERLVALESLVEHRIGGKIELGASLYEEKQLILLQEFARSRGQRQHRALQFQWNILDREFAAALQGSSLAGQHVTLRSCFLQGLLLLSASELGSYPEKFQVLLPLLQRLDELARAYGLERYELLLLYSLQFCTAVRELVLAEGPEERPASLRLAVGLQSKAELLYLINSLKRLSSLIISSSNDTLQILEALDQLSQSFAGLEPEVYRPYLW